MSYRHRDYMGKTWRGRISGSDPFHPVAEAARAIAAAASTVAPAERITSGLTGHHTCERRACMSHRLSGERKRFDQSFYRVLGRPVLRSRN